MKFKHKEVLDFYNGIVTMQRLPDKIDEYLTYSLSKNKRFMQDRYDSIQEAQKSILGDYNKKLRELGLKWAEKDGGGKPIIAPNGVVSFGGNMLDYKNEVDLLDIEFKEQLDKNKVFMETIEDTEVYTHKHPFPAGFGDVIDLLFPMRQEPVAPAPIPVPTPEKKKE